MTRFLPHHIDIQCGLYSSAPVAKTAAPCLISVIAFFGFDLGGEIAHVPGNIQDDPASLVNTWMDGFLIHGTFDQVAQVVPEHPGLPGCVCMLPGRAA